jgi:hypothetical protein
LKSSRLALSVERPSLRSAAASSWPKEVFPAPVRPSITMRSRRGESWLIVSATSPMSLVRDPDAGSGSGCRHVETDSNELTTGMFTSRHHAARNRGLRALCTRHPRELPGSTRRCCRQEICSWCRLPGQQQPPAGLISSSKNPAVGSSLRSATTAKESGTSARLRGSSTAKTVTVRVRRVLVDECGTRRRVTRPTAVLLARCTFHGDRNYSIAQSDNR